MKSAKVGSARRWETGEAQIFTLWRRRRVGKTLFTGRTALRVPDWRSALDGVADWAQEGPVVLVLDEFQFLAKENTDIGSIINFWWRERGETLPILLILSGSEVGFFEREIAGYSATTYGRRSGQLRLRPFKAKEVGLFVPGWTAEDKIAAYAVFGHMPYYLAQIDPGESLADNILSIVLMPDGLLHEEARLLLDQEMADASAYFSVLRAIAAGQTRVSQIASRTGIGSSRVSQMLELLRNLWLVEKQLPVTVKNPSVQGRASTGSPIPTCVSGSVSCFPPRGGSPMPKAPSGICMDGCCLRSTSSSRRPRSKRSASNGCCVRPTRRPSDGGGGSDERPAPDNHGTSTAKSPSPLPTMTGR